MLRWLMFPVRFVVTVSRVLSADSGFFPVDSDAEPDGGWNDLDTVPANAFFAFSLLIPWRVIDTITRLEEFEGEVPGVSAMVAAFFALEISPGSLLTFLVVPLGMFWALQFKVVMRRVIGQEFTFRESWTAVAYAMGAGFASFCLLAFVGVPVISLLGSLGGEDVGMGLTILMGFVGFGLFMAVCGALARATGGDDIEVYLALLLMFCFPWIAFLLPKRD